MSFVSMSVMPLAPVLAGVLLSRSAVRARSPRSSWPARSPRWCPTLSRSVRSVPRPAVWQAELAQRTPDPVVAAA